MGEGLSSLMFYILLVTLLCLLRLAPLMFYISLVGFLFQSETDFLITCDPLLTNSMPDSIVIRYHIFKTLFHKSLIVLIILRLDLCLEIISGTKSTSPGRALSFLGWSTLYRSRSKLPFSYSYATSNVAGFSNVTPHMI